MVTGQAGRRYINTLKSVLATIYNISNARCIYSIQYI